MNPKKIHMLSKSRFLAGMHCPLRLWYQCNNPDLVSKPTLVQQTRLEKGQEIERLAREHYSGGQLIEEDPLHHNEAVRTTNATITFSDVPAIFQAAFLHEDVRIRTDILERVDENHWNLLEVKSVSKVKADHLYDLGIQYHVLKGSGLDIHQAGYYT